MSSRDYAKPLIAFTPVPGVGDLLAKVGDDLTSTSTEKAFEEIQKLLTEKKKRIVVFIDDIDRLDRREIESLFRLVKLTANFDYTTFVLAFDDERVAQILGESYGSGGRAAGKSFLEKIVQLPLQLPKISSLDLHKYCLKQIENVLQAENLIIGNDLWLEFTHQIMQGIQPCINTPRMAKRYAHTIAFAIPTLINEVNLVDLMLLEGIRLFCPVLYDAIYRTRGFELTDSERLLASTSKPRSLEDKVCDIFKDGDGYTEIQKTGFVAIIVYLFPLSRHIHASLEGERRIGDGSYFDRYFQYAVPSGDISNGQIDLLIKLLDGAPEAVSDMLQELSQGQRAELLVFELTPRVETLDSKKAKSLAEAMAGLSDRFLDRGDDFGHPSGVYWSASNLLRRLILKVGVSERYQLIQYLLKLDSVGALTLRALARLAYENQKNSEKEIFPENLIPSIAQLVNSKVKELLENDIVHKSHPTFTRDILYAWGVWGSETEIQDYFHQQIRYDKARRIQLLRVYFDRNFPEMYWKSDGYDPLTKLLDPKILHELLEKDFKWLEFKQRYNPDDLVFKQPPLSDEEIAWRFQFLFDQANNMASQQAIP